jgi:hypothetical protein
MRGILAGRASERFATLLWPDLRHELALRSFARDVWQERRPIHVSENEKMGRSGMPTDLPIPEEGRQICPFILAILQAAGLTTLIPSFVTPFGNCAAIQWQKFGV